MSATAEWKRRIEEHNAQTIRTRGDLHYDDLWSILAERFRDDPFRTGDPVVDTVAAWLQPESTVLDVGGGAGRYALPLALKCRQVTVVDPSPSMLEQLRRACEETGITNVDSVQSSWEEADVPPASVVFCANVVYGVSEIEAFVRKLEQHARERVAIVLFMDAPLSRMSPIWQAVHGEARIDMPALPELLPVLWEMDIYPNLTMCPPAMTTRTMPDLETALAITRHFLYIQPGSEKDARLREVLPQFLSETEGGLIMRGQSQRPQGIVWWPPAP